MSYNVEQLSSFQLLLDTSGTVWRRKRLWHISWQLFVLSFFVAILVLILVGDPAALQVSKFQKISTFLSVFVGLLLGFFMSSSMARWYSCATGFLELFDAIRLLQMQLFALGVPEEKIDDCIRYTMLSAWLLSLQLKVDVYEQNDDASMKDIESVWQLLRIREGENEGEEDQTGGDCVIRSGMLPEDEAMLRTVDDPSSVLWLWVASIVGTLSCDGEVPPMQSPTYCNLINLTERGHAGIRQVRASVSVQPPFIYVQALAALVHINNIINAISFGMTWGTSLGTTLAAFHAFGSNGARWGEVARDIQDVIVSFFLSCFGPFIYVALLEVAVAIAQPFSSKDGEIPTKRLLEKLEKDLLDGKRMATNLPERWTKPRFKK
jgi:predicted membrane chloride channel (bestrophin family)